MDTTIGERIKARRLELGYSQDDVAIKMGYKSRSTINKIELGINGISQSKVKDFAMVLQTTEAYIMGLEPIYIDKEDKKFIETIRPHLKTWDELTDEEFAVRTLLNTLSYDIKKIDGRIVFFDKNGAYDISEGDFSGMLNYTKEAIRLAAQELEAKHQKALFSELTPTEAFSAAADKKGDAEKWHNLPLDKKS